MRTPEERLNTLLESVKDYKESREYRVEEIKFEIMEQISVAMAARDVNRAELARRMGTSPAYITKILRGNCNFTLETIERISESLGYKLTVRLSPKGFSYPELSVYKNKFSEFGSSRQLPRTSQLKGVETNESNNAA